jgi:hypothetical protein
VDAVAAGDFGIIPARSRPDNAAREQIEIEAAILADMNGFH